AIQDGVHHRVGDTGRRGDVQLEVRDVRDLVDDGDVRALRVESAETRRGQQAGLLALLHRDDDSVDLRQVNEVRELHGKAARVGQHVAQRVVIDVLKAAADVLVE